MLNQNFEHLYVIIDKNGNPRLKGETNQIEFVIANTKEGETYHYGDEIARKLNADWKEPAPTIEITPEEMENEHIRRMAEQHNITEEEVRRLLEIRKQREEQN